MTLAGLNDFVVKELEPSLGKGEAKATSLLLLEDCLGVDRTALLIRGDRIIEPETEERFRKMVARISAGEPPQYVVGSARFMGMTLKVTPATLIPRPETAELVDIVVDRLRGRSDLRILDVGTGSGCIAIALSRALPFARVTALDISPEALEVARENARNLRADITFVQGDILSGDDFGRFDAIVSNPPYIAESERAAMESRVKDHEPAGALFVPDSDPLKFYKAVADYADRTDARPNLFFEINPLYADALKKMLDSRGFDCDLLRDSFGKIRFAVT